MRLPQLSLLLLPLLLLACNKHDDEAGQWTITPALLRDASCSDTTDDGIFETWNSTEDSLMFPGSGNDIMPASLVVPGYLLQMNLGSSRISLNDPSFTLHAVYDTGLNWATEFLLVDKASGNIEGRSYTSRSTKPGSDSLNAKLRLSNGTGLTPGCRRLYYYGIKVAAPLNLSAGQVGSSAHVLFKGHFDVEVY
jgi:hypothetical protein